MHGASSREGYAKKNREDDLVAFCSVIAAAVWAKSRLPLGLWLEYSIRYYTPSLLGWSKKIKRVFKPRLISQFRCRPAVSLKGIFYV
jgi:hypothetical protein